MATIIDNLKAEHGRFEQLIKLLERKSIFGDDMAASNIALLVDALYYLTRYPDVNHHALEDRISEKLVEKKVLSSELGNEMRSQHATLARQGHELIQDLEAVIRGENMSRELLEIHVHLYAERLRHNMAIEEIALFPVAARSLDGDDWAAISQAAPQLSADPLFHTPVHERFMQLHLVITAEAECESKDNDA